MSDKEKKYKYVMKSLLYSSVAPFSSPLGARGNEEASVMIQEGGE